MLLVFVGFCVCVCVCVCVSVCIFLGEMYSKQPQTLLFRVRSPAISLLIGPRKS